MTAAPPLRGEAAAVLGWMVFRFMALIVVQVLFMEDLTTSVVKMDSMVCWLIWFDAARDPRAFPEKEQRPLRLQITTNVVACPLQLW